MAAFGSPIPYLVFFVPRIELRALSKISPGDELTVSYVDFLNVSEERQKQLKKQYYFDCTCEHCKKKIKDDLMLAVKEGDKKVWSCGALKQRWLCVLHSLGTPNSARVRLQQSERCQCKKWDQDWNIIEPNTNSNMDSLIPIMWQAHRFSFLKSPQKLPLTLTVQQQAEG